MWFSRKPDLAKLSAAADFAALLALVNGDDREVAGQARRVLAKQFATRSPDRRVESSRAEHLARLLNADSPQSLDVLVEVLLCWRGLSLETGAIVRRLLERGARDRVAAVLENVDLDDNVRDNVVRELLTVGASKGTLDLLFLAIRHIGPLDQIDAEDFGRPAAFVLARAAEDRLVAELAAARSYGSVWLLCRALGEVGGEKALAAIASMPLPKPNSLFAPTAASLGQTAAQAIVERLGSDALESLASAGGPHAELAAAELARRATIGEAEAAAPLLDPSDPSACQAAMATIATMGRWNSTSGSALRGPARAKAIAALRAIVTRPGDLELRRGAYDTLQAIGETPPRFMP